VQLQFPPESQVSSWLGAAFSAFAENSAWSIGVDRIWLWNCIGEAVTSVVRLLDRLKAYASVFFSRNEPMETEPIFSS